MTKRKADSQAKYYRKQKKKFIEKHGEEEWKRRRRESQRRYVEKNREEINRKHREWEANNKEKVSRWKRDYRLGLRRHALINYGGDPPKCACCGETHEEFLTIDHIDGKGAEHRRRIGRGEIFGWLKKNKYPDGFRILCYNCNCALGHRGYCPHNRVEVEI